MNSFVFNIFLIIKLNLKSRTINTFKVNITSYLHSEIKFNMHKTVNFV